MGKIHQMDDILSNKIAAGEVVERPASVVKELVENSIDAGSDRIEIEVEEAGLSKIRVIDNGDGIEKDDCLLAFARHATSKIKDENDLFRIRSLGFRGEALPSIASVSMLELKSGTGDGPGTHLILRGGEITQHESTNSRKGTEFIISNLFFNTPARLKYMKTVHTELGNISDIVNRMALAHPNVSFRLLHNGKKLLHTSGNGDILQVIAGIYGMGVAKKMIPIQLESLDFNVTGFIAKPEITRASRNYISTIINGRFIKNYPLVKAIQQGYHTLLPIGRFPIVALNIEMDPVLVDVNVHPAKLEVRLSKEHELQQLVENGIKQAFKKEQLIPEVQAPQKKEKQESEQQTLSFNYTTPKAQQVKEESPFDSIQATIVESGEIDHTVEENYSENRLINQSQEVVKEDHFVPEPSTTAVKETEEIIDKQQDRIPPLYPIGQMHGTYIIAQNDQGMFLIDQHAAQERVKYEYFRDKVGEVSNELQELLVPLTFEFSQSESMHINANLIELEKVGLFLDSFGPQSYIVRSHPTWFPKGMEQEIIEEIIQQLLDQKKVDIKKLREEAAIMMSCKASIKANHHLRNDEIFALLESLRHSCDPFTCPHGRPILIHFSTYEIEKMFKRVM